MSSAAAVSLPSVGTSSAILSMPPPRVSTFFPSTTAAISSSFSGPSTMGPTWISQQLNQQKRKVPIAPMDFSVIPSKRVKKQKPVTCFSQSAVGERVMEITYPNPLKEKKDLSPTDFIVTQVTMGTSSESLQGEALSAVDALCKKLQEIKEEKRQLKEQNKYLLQALQKMGSAPPTTAAETSELLSQEKINEYAKIGEQGMAVSAWRSQILKDSEKVIAEFSDLYLNISKVNKELQALAGPISEELEHARLQHEAFQQMFDCSVEDLVKFGVFGHPRALNKIMSTLDYRVDQLEFILEKIDKVKEEALDAMHQMERIVLNMSPGLLTPSFTLRKADETTRIFKEIASQGTGPEVTFDTESINNLLACRDFIGFLIEAEKDYSKLPEKLIDERETCEAISDRHKDPSQDQLGPIINKFMEYRSQFHISSPEEQQKQSTPFRPQDDDDE
ncbi:hypothetical protein KI387_040604 [Taxus chinensis]|uniref:Uncharacterized protein n=1 Tax=Taxus chinensis TaxID=29808 RepID=A0AA38F9L2_TAXCH|nr:hypothetical protein KI387_040604 [Taxus chinensis]